MKSKTFGGRALVALLVVGGAVAAIALAGGSQRERRARRASTAIQRCVVERGAAARARASSAAATTRRSARTSGRASSRASRRSCRDLPVVQAPRRDDARTRATTSISSPQRGLVEREGPGDPEEARHAAALGADPELRRHLPAVRARRAPRRSSCSCLPPDTNGAAGATQYVQMVNTDFAVYSKTGQVLRHATPIDDALVGVGR